MDMEAAREATYEAASDALYLGLATNFAGCPRSFISKDGDVVVDVVDGVLVGIEVLGASNHPIFRRILPDMQGAELLSFSEGVG